MEVCTLSALFVCAALDVKVGAVGLLVVAFSLLQITKAHDFGVVASSSIEVNKKIA